MPLGGVLRVLRYGIGQPLLYPIDARDETILTRRQATLWGQVGFFLMALSYGAWVRAIGRTRLAK